MLVQSVFKREKHTVLVKFLILPVNNPPCSYMLIFYNANHRHSSFESLYPKDFRATPKVDNLSASCDASDFC